MKYRSIEEILESESRLIITPNNVNLLKSLPKFPIEVFPENVQSIIIEAERGMNLSVNYLASSFITAAATLFDGKIQLHTPNNHIARPIFWICILGNAGGAKTSAVNIFLKYLYTKTRVEKERYELEKSTTPDKDQHKVQKPVSLITSDTTTEAIVTKVNSSRRGICYHVDEMIAFIQNMNKYRKGDGGDQAFWLSMFTGSEYYSTRASRDDIAMPETCIQVIGTMQTPRIIEMFKTDQDPTGFLDRFLFALDIQPYSKWNRDRIDSKLFSKLDDIFDKMGAMPSLEDPIEFSDTALDLMFKWQHQLSDIANESYDEYEIQALKKDEIYINRIALILHLIKNHGQFPYPGEITDETVNNTFKVMQYFSDTRDLVKASIKKQMDSTDDVFERLEAAANNAHTKEDHIKVVKEFRNLNIGVKIIADALGISARSVVRYSSKNYNTTEDREETE